MDTVSRVLTYAEDVVFVTLAAVAILRWRARRGAMRAWIAATFGVLAFVALLGTVVPSKSTATWVTWVTRFEVVLLALFPYFLYRFVASFLRTRRWMDVTAATLTVAAALFVLPVRVTATQPRTAGFKAWLALFVLSWVAQSMFVAVRLWRGGAGQPTIARRRMRMLGLGAAGLALALILAGVAESSASGLSIAAQSLGLAAAPLFLIGVGPPRMLLALWRDQEEEEFRRTVTGLMGATTPADVARALLPHATRMLGGRASVLVDARGDVMGSFGFTDDEARVVASGDITTIARPEGNSSILSVPLDEGGRLVIEASPYTPYFGREELQFIGGLTGLIDLALARSRLMASERAALEELRSANETMRDFVAIASHDLRTPISVIRGFSDLLSADWQKVADDDKRGYVEAIRRQSGYLARLVEDLLTVSRIDARVIEPHLVPVDVDAAVRRAVENSPYPDGQIRIEPAPGVQALADVEHLARILQNYLDNAFAYGQPPVRIVTGPSDGTVQVRVIDAGSGVPPEFVPRMFQKFARADKAKSKRTQGTGLGLSIVRGLALAAGGDAWYEPAPGGGACFVVSFRAA